jgi:hypothetical protein
MWYAAAEIIIFLLAAAVVGGGIGFGLAKANKISVARAFDRSGAYAPAERELAAARDQIDVLTARLAVATAAVRELEAERAASAPRPEPVVATLHDEDDDYVDYLDGFDEPRSLADDPAPLPSPSGLRALASVPEERRVGITFGPEDTGHSAPAPEANGEGKRLSERVAEAAAFSLRPIPPTPRAPVDE